MGADLTALAKEAAIVCVNRAFAKLIDQDAAGSESGGSIGRDAAVGARTACASGGGVLFATAAAGDELGGISGASDTSVVPEGAAAPLPVNAATPGMTPQADVSVAEKAYQTCLSRLVHHK